MVQGVPRALSAFGCSEALSAKGDDVIKISSGDFDSSSVNPDIRFEYQ